MIHLTVPCDYCGVGINQRCVTSSGKPYREPNGHKVRWDAAHAARGEAHLKASQEKHAASTRAAPEPPQNGGGRTNRIRLALWFIEKAGGVEKARYLFELAVETLEQLPEEED